MLLVHVLIPQVIGALTSAVNTKLAPFAGFRLQPITMRSKISWKTSITEMADIPIQMPSVPPISLSRRLN